MPSVYSLHVEKWRDCQKCSLCHNRGRVVIARGDIPCDLLLIGESPGHSEDTIGKPFCGPAGAVLDSIIRQSIGDRKLRIAFTNLVCCIPLDEDMEKTGEPDAVEITACGDRLREFVGIVRPKMIVAVGTLSKKWLPKLLPDWKSPFIEIVHPAFIIRQPAVQQSFSVKRCCIILRNAAQEVFG